MDALRLSGIEHGGLCRIEAVEESPAKPRLQSLGLVPGALVTPLFTASSGSPTAYSVRGAVVALRRADAERIKVTRLWD